MNYPSNSDSVAQDQIKAFVERIERMNEERRAIADDIKEIYAEAKGNGFDTKALKIVIRKREQDSSERLELEAIVELYEAALGMRAAPRDDEDEEPRAPAPARTREIIEEFGARTASVDTHSLQNPQRTPDQSNMHDLHIAPDSAIGANTTADPAEGVPPASSAEPADRQQLAASGFTGEGEAGSPVLPTNPGEAQASPALVKIEYAAPGVVVMEKCPPEGIVAHPYATCWPVNDIDVAGGVREPVVKIGKLILDGRGRYFAARTALIEYPVVQYDGNDPLLDCIRCNLASRNMSGAAKRIVAHKLSKLEPERADEIMALFELVEERQAAE